MTITTSHEICDLTDGECLRTEGGATCEQVCVIVGAGLGAMIGSAGGATVAGAVVGAVAGALASEAICRR